MSRPASAGPLAADLDNLATELASAYGCWAPSLTRDARWVAFISDRRGVPELWIQRVDGSQPASVLTLSADPVLKVHWSPEGRWLACAVATRGGVRTEVWLVRPDGTGARRVAGDPEHAILGPWTRKGAHLVVTIAGDGPDQLNRSVVIDPDSGAGETVAVGRLVEVLDLSPEQRFALVREGTRGAQHCRLLDRGSGVSRDVLAQPAAGSTDLGLLRPAPAGNTAALVAYVVTDAGRPRRALAAEPCGEDGHWHGPSVIAERDDAEVDFADADDAGRSMLIVWNVDGRSEVDVLDLTTGVRRRLPGVPGVPGAVISGGVLARNGRRAVLAVDHPMAPHRLWVLDLDSEHWQPLTQAPALWEHLVTPTLERLVSHDGLEISGWLYRPLGAGPDAAAVVSLHGGPESQERPAFNAHHQMLASAGFVVFAPNIRGSSGYGRAFVHADDRFGRLDAIADVDACGRWLAAEGLADTARLAVAGRSDGGYATFMALVCHPERFAAGIATCGMSDLLTFYRDTEPWIARAAITKYGDPRLDAELLAALSPLRQVEALRAPLLVIHGERDTNVPVSESRQMVEALRALGRPVEYLQLDGEGHEFLHVFSRRRLLVAITQFLERTIGSAG